MARATNVVAHPLWAATGSEGRGRSRAARRRVQGFSPEASASLRRPGDHDRALTPAALPDTASAAPARVLRGGLRHGLRVGVGAAAGGRSASGSAPSGGATSTSPRGRSACATARPRTRPGRRGGASGGARDRARRGDDPSRSISPAASRSAVWSGGCPVSVLGPRTLVDFGSARRRSHAPRGNLPMAIRWARSGVMPSDRS
jgi:hypothetical protein